MPDELDLLRELGRELAEPDDKSVARARALLEQRAGLAPPARTRPRRRARLRWAPLVATAALLVGSGLGFGVGSSVTPSGSARGNVVGLGFIPADRWNVTQTGAIGETGVARAVAANVPFDSDDDASELPDETLRRLSPTGVVIVARFSPRGDQTADARFPLRSLPLRVADAVPADLPRGLSGTSVVPLRLRASAGGYNVDVRVFVGAPLSAALLAAVDGQLGRLVMAPGSVTFVVQPRIIRHLRQSMSIFGSVSSARAGEKVTVQFKGCGLNPLQFRDAFETTTNPGGGFSVEFPPPLSPGVSGVFRAVHGDSVSAEVPVRHQAPVTLRILGRGRFEAAVTGMTPFWRRYVVLQQYQRARGVWVNVRRLVLTEQGYSGSSSTATVLTVPFRPPVSRGTRIRVVFPLSQARPCYVAGVSEERRA